MQQVSRRKNADRTAETKARLISAARDIFADKPYPDVSTPDLVAAAGVTRGALYHHYKDKADLFRAVVEEEAQQVAQEIEGATSMDMHPIDALQKGAAAYLTAMRKPGRTRILLIDGPAVLGAGEIEQIDRRHAARTLKEGIAFAVSSGAMRHLPVEETTAMLSGAFDRAALSITSDDDLAKWTRVLNATIEGLFHPAQ